jgi:Na+/melibiose symporter-like transporter
MEAPAFRLNGWVKASYGFGLAAEGIKQNAFSIFLLFYYQQIVGLDSALCGLALFISLCVDAVADPAIGVWSDGIRSKLGRRHPLMYLGIAPLALSYYAVFVPPQGMSQVMIFLWLVTFATVARFAMALFVIPHTSLVPELTSDIGQRTTLTSLRTAFAWIFGLLNSLMAYQVFLRGTLEHPQGLLNPAGYPRLAAFGACTMAFAMLVSAMGTQRAALAVQPSADKFGETPLHELPKAIKQVLGSQSYRAALFAGLALFVGYGMTENMNNYMNTFFWGFTSEQLGMFIFVIFAASILVMMMARSLVQRFGNRNLGIASSILLTAPTPLLIGMRLAGFLPDPGDPKLFTLLAVSTFVAYCGLIMGMTVIGTMIADITDEYELTTGMRQEGLLFSANMFLTKAASGLGTLVAGVLIRLARFPENAATTAVDPSLVSNLGWASIAGSLLFGILMVYFFAQYRLDGETHRRIVAQLAERRRNAPLPAAEPIEQAAATLARTVG